MKTLDRLGGFLIGIAVTLVALLIIANADMNSLARKVEACQFAGYDTSVHDLAHITYCAYGESLVLYEVE